MIAFYWYATALHVCTSSIVKSPTRRGFYAAEKCSTGILRMYLHSHICMYGFTMYCTHVGTHIQYICDAKPRLIC